MSKYKNVEAFFSDKGSEDIERFIDKNLDITEQIYELMKARGLKQKDLATQLGKSDAELSKWLSGTHNLTLRSIAKMEAALNADIILTPQKAAQKFQEINYVYMKVYANSNEMAPDNSLYSETAPSITEFGGDETVKVA